MLTETPLRGVRDRVLLMRSLPSLAGLDFDSLTMMADHARVRHFAPGERLMRAGEPVHAVHIVLEGRVRITLHGRTTAEQTRADGVGWLSMMGGDVEREAVAVEPTSTLEFPVDVLWYCFETNFSLVRNGLRLLAGQILDRRGQLPASPSYELPDDLGVWRDDDLTLVERLIEMRRLPAFADCPLDAIAALAERITERRYEPGVVLWRAGEVSEHTLDIKYGRVRCTAPDGNEVVIGAPYVIGVNDGMAGRNRAYSAVTETKVLALHFDVTIFYAVLEEHFDLARRFLALMAQTISSYSTPERFALPAEPEGRQAPAAL